MHQMKIHAFVCKDTETRGRGEVRRDDSVREQSRGEEPGDKLRAIGGQSQHGKDSEGQRRNGTHTKKMEEGGGKRKQEMDKNLYCLVLDIELRLKCTSPSHCLLV